MYIGGIFFYVSAGMICKTHYNSFQRALACQYVTSTVSRAFKGSEKCPGAARTLSHVPGPEGIYNVPFIGNALQFRSYSEYWTVFLFESLKLLGHRSTAVLVSVIFACAFFNRNILNSKLNNTDNFPFDHPILLCNLHN